MKYYLCLILLVICCELQPTSGGGGHGRRHARLEALETKIAGLEQQMSNVLAEQTHMKQLTESVLAGCNGKPVVQCFADPCEVSSCENHPNATCTSNYCDGCNAVWTDASGNTVSCKEDK